MKNMLKQIAICATISGLFVLAVFAQRQVGLLGPETSRVALATAAVLPPGPTGVVVVVQDGPNFPPPPIDIPSRKTGLKDGPNFPPPPIDIPRS